MLENQKSSRYFFLVLLLIFPLLISSHSVEATVKKSAKMGTKFGAPTKGMSRADYQALVFLDPQNTIRMDWAAVRSVPGYFLIDNQGEPTVSVVDYHQGKTIKKIQMGETGNHHLWIIPGGRYAWSSQRYEKDVFWTIDLQTLEVIDKFSLSKGNKKIIAPLHLGFGYTRPIAVVGNALDKNHGYLTMLSTVTRRPTGIITVSCDGVRDAMFTLDDKKIFATCTGKRRGITVVDVATKKELMVVSIKGARTGAMTPNGKYFLVGAKDMVQVFNTRNNKLVAKIAVPGGQGNFTCLQDSSKCYNGLRNKNAVAVLNMKTFTLIKTIKTGPDANRLYLNPVNSRYGIFANEAGKSEVVTVIDTKKDIAVKNIITGLGPHNVAFDPTGKFAIVSTKKETDATLIDTSATDPAKWDVITTEIAAGIQNNGVRWVPSSKFLKSQM
jgi:DNA-binding beta-propeller fold protein YncE